jgi:hypothetical protein
VNVEASAGEFSKGNMENQYVEVHFSVVAFVLVAFIGLLAIQYLFGFYEQRAKGIAKVGRSVVAKWDFDVKDLGGFSYWLLILFSVAGMFFEMMMIRWVSSEIRVFAYFKNFVLVACFFGLLFQQAANQPDCAISAVAAAVLADCTSVDSPENADYDVAQPAGKQCGRADLGRAVDAYRLGHDDRGDSDHRADFCVTSLLLHSIWADSRVAVGERRQGNSGV